MGRLVLALSLILVAALAASGGWIWLQRRPGESPVRVSARAREQWRMPPLALLRHPTWSPGRKIAILALRGYLVVAVLLLVVKAVQLATGA